MSDVRRADRILVVDDEPALRRAVSQMLRAAGFEAFEAEDGASALELARAHQPDLVLTDVDMPRMGGLGLLLALRSDATTAALPVVFVTGRPDKLGMREGISLGADDYISKPFAAAELLSVVRARLARHRQILERSESSAAHARSRIQASLPHELLTPLSSILGLAELLQIDGATMTPSDVTTMAAQIHQSGHALLRSVRNLLLHHELEIEVARVDAPAARRHERTEAPADVIEEAARELARAAGRPRDLTVNVMDRAVDVGPDDLRKIAEELVDNAFKFSRPGTPGYVTCGPSEGGFVLSVRDEGRGMTAEQVSRIDAFQQFDRKRYEQQGLGLGLSIARRLAARRGGSLVVSSATGEGTTALVRLP